MKVLSLHQPWASLVAWGIKTIETRSWQTSYRGPLLIHAAKTTAGIDSLPGDCEGKTEAGWTYGYIGPYQAAYCHRTSDEGRRGDAHLHGGELDIDLPLGKIIAIANLVDCAPIGGPEEFRTGLVDGDEGDYPGRHVLAVHHRHFAHDDGDHPVLILDTPEGHTIDVTDQWPYGNFDHGRWAWVLENIMTYGPYDARGRQGLWEWEAPGG